jgi:hypothetical protein
MCDYKGCANPHRFYVKSKCWTKEDECKAKAIASAASKSLRRTVAKPQGDESDSLLDSGNHKVQFLRHIYLIETRLLHLYPIWN